MRDQAIAKAGELGLDVPRGTSRAKKNRGTNAGECPGRCECGQTFDDYMTFEREHAGTDGHRRWSIDLEGVEMP